jgi:predicted regulator of Ras-like GTPase activity (Roadblock/LC7/MglB family)
VTDPLANALHRVSRVPGVTGALIVDAEGGVPVLADLREGVAGAAVAALAAALYQRTSNATDAAGLGRLDSFHLEAEAGHVVAAGAGELVVIAIVADDAQLGLVRIETQRAAQTLHAWTGSGA